MEKQPVNKLFTLLLTLLFSTVGIKSMAQNWETFSTETSCTNRHENSLVAIGDEIILVGGRGIKPVEAFGFKTKTWTKKIETPLEMHHFQAIAYKNELWVVGGFTGKYPHETPIPDIYIFNLQKNEWRKGAAIPQNRQRGAAGAFVYKNNIYLVCGIQDGHWDGHVAWLDKYNPQTNTWEKLPDAPHVRDHVQAVVIDDKIYVAGGRRSTARINQVLNLTEPAVDVFDFKTNQWTTLPESQNLPTLRAGASSVVLGKKMVVIGGESGTQIPAHSEAEALDTKTLTWQKLPPLKQGRHGTGATVYKGKIVTVAGSGNRGGGPELNSMEVFQ
ncbi:MAG: kelch repeat-containing protein [Spirosomataceae bacterium]